MRTIIYGPPGTGKTRITISILKAIDEYNKSEPGEGRWKSGIFSSTNLSVSNVVESIQDSIPVVRLTSHKVPEKDRSDLDKAVDIINKIKDQLEFESVDAAPNVAKISVVGMAMRTQPGVAKKMFETLAAKGVNLHVISTSEIKISVLIDAEYTELAVRSLHTAYGLDDEA